MLYRTNSVCRVVLQMKGLSYIRENESRESFRSRALAFMKIKDGGEFKMAALLKSFFQFIFLFLQINRELKNQVISSKNYSQVSFRVTLRIFIVTEKKSREKEKKASKLGRKSTRTLQNPSLYAFLRSLLLSDCPF